MKDSLNALMKEYHEYLSLGNEEQEHHYYPTNILALNRAIGDNRGVRGGTIMQLIGEPGHGKSTLSLDYLACAQRSGIKEITLPNGKIINAVYADFERTFDKKYAAMLGVDTSKLLIVKTPFAEQSFMIIEELLAAGIQFVIIDSISAIIPKSEEDKTLEDSEKIASEAKVLGRFTKRVVQLADSADALVIYINQYRSNLSPMARTDKVPYGARLIKHAVRVSVELIKVQTEANRITIKAFVSKTKLGATGVAIQYYMINGQGPDIAEHILTLALEYGIVTKKGAWYTYKDIQGQGMNNAAKLFPIAEIKELVVKEMDKDGTIE